MKTTFKKSLAVLLSICMLFSILSMNITANADSVPAEIMETNVPYEICGTAYFSFTPAESGTYIFRSDIKDSSIDTYGHIYSDPDFMNEIASNDDSGGNMCFKITTYLDAGITYYLKARPYSENYEATYLVSIKMAPQVSKIEFVKNNSNVIKYDTNIGYWEEYNDTYGNEKTWFRYSEYSILSNCEFKVTYTDGTTETIYGYNGDLSYSSTQSSSKQWKIGGKNNLTVSYFGKSVTFSVPIKETNIKSISVVDDEGYQYLEKNEGNGDWHADYNTRKFWYSYNYYNALQHLTIKITYKNGKTEYTSYRTGNYLSNALVTTNQTKDKQWSIGGKKNTITINIQGVKTTYNAKIKKYSSYSDFQCYFNENDKTASLEGYVGTKKTGVKIPKEIGGYKITYIGSDAFWGTDFYKNKSNWKDGALYIGDWLIRVNTTATSFTVKSGTKYIAAHAFSGCEKLQTLTLPSSVEIVNYNSFLALKKINYKGSTEKLNSICSNIWSEVSLTQNATGAACKHSWSWVTEAKANKYVNGYRHKECSKCGLYKEGSYQETTSLLKAKVTGIKDKTYTGKSLTQSITVKIGSKTLKKDTDYTISYKDNKKVGKATVTIKGKGIYVDSINKTFKITPVETSVSKVSAAKKSLKVTVKKKSSQVTGYQIQYSTSKSFKSAKTKTIKSYKTTSATIKSLKAKKTYYVRVRTYKTVGKTKYYSDWSKAVSKKTK